ncbi:MAG: threonine--tRNA ligase [Candidatus Methanoperedens sp.]|nr:threonine--tRNA ligase [Candidatus Methanoperedens sp.]MCZ7369771.1 threonine--tRNA ligase [Candidatus Methanoperedens sp.]
MQILLIHSDYIEYETKRSTPVAEKIGDELKKGRMEEALTVFLAVEKNDEENIEYVARQTADEIKKVTEQVKTNRVMLYPYAHLSSSLASPKTAVEALRKLEELLKEAQFEVKRAPFGWYKSFTIKCKGHPLSELSRTIRIGEEKCVTMVKEKEEVVSEALKSEAKATSYWHILTPEGDLLKPDDFDFTGHEKLKKFVNYEIHKSRAVDRVPPHVELMRRLELADYEPGSDQGNMRFYPKGRLVKSLLENYVLEETAKRGAMEVETPIMYDMNHPTLKKYLDRFPARQYSIEADKKMLFLRFAACFGQFLMNHDMTISYRNLPLRMVELTRYSFRKEQSGELVGLRRLRAFTMPDMHTLCRDMEEAVAQFNEQYNMCINVLSKIGLDLNDYEVAIRFTRDFFEANRDFIVNLVKTVNKPVLIELWDQRFFYFVLKFEFNYIDAMDKASALSTVQIDVENAERYGIKYVDSTGAEKRPVILHCSPSGAIERCIYALLEKANMDSEKGIVPMFPVWLSPTQVRIIPVAEKHLDYAGKVAGELNCRADIDDREETVSKRIRDAGKDWIPYVAVVGDEEINNDNLTVTVRSESSPNKPVNIKMTAAELNERVSNEISGYPFKRSPLAMRLSGRPRFV